MAKKEEVKVQDINDRLTVLGQELGALKTKYTEHYNAMQEIEKQVTAKAGAIAALNSLLAPVSKEEDK